MKRIYKFLTNIFHTLIPKTCIQCGSLLEEDEKLLCASCKDLLPFDNFLNQEYFAPLTPYAKEIFVFSKYQYCNDIIKKFKFSGFIHIGKKFAESFADRLQQESWIDNIDCIVPVPLHKVELRNRGFNQCDIIADVLGKKLNLPVVKNNLVKLHHTKAQHNLSAHERYNNLKNNFALKDISIFQGKNILLLDDVITTCSTLQAVCQTFNKVEGINLYVCAMASDRNNF